MSDMGPPKPDSNSPSGIRLCGIDAVKPGQGKEIFLSGPDGGTYLVLLRGADGIVAYHNECPHQGRPMNWAVDQFLISKEGHLVCAHHGACFDIDSGRCISGPCEGAGLQAVDVQIADSGIYLRERLSPSEEVHG